MYKRVNRRTVLRGMLGGAAVTVGLPLLEGFLNDNGTALANGVPIPVRFGTWFWGLGMTPKLFTPDKVGHDFDLKEELTAIRPVKHHINLFSHYLLLTDGRPSLCHHSGWVALRSGQAPVDRYTMPAPSIDVIVGDRIGGSTRFRSLEMTATGDKNVAHSFRSAEAFNQPEVSPLAFYQRVFGSEFQDPNAADFRPNPDLMVRKSVLSAVREDRTRLHKVLGAADRERLDQFFTSLRSLEERLALQLQKPPPALACRTPSAPSDVSIIGLDVDVLAERHRLMTDVLVAALACDQTRVFNMSYSESTGRTTKKGHHSVHHTITHEETPNAQGVQETHSWFVRQAMQEWAYFVEALAAVHEGERTLLDNTLVFCHSDHEWAQVHSVNGIPMMTAGRAGGRIRSGLHVDGRNQAVSTEVGLTVMQAMGMEMREWGGGSMRATNTIEEILV